MSQPSIALSLILLDNFSSMIEKFKDAAAQSQTSPGTIDGIDIALVQPVRINRPQVQSPAGTAHS